MTSSACSSAWSRSKKSRVRRSSSSPADRSAAVTLSGTADQRTVMARWSACSTSRIRLKMVEESAPSTRSRSSSEEVQRHRARQRQASGDALEDPMGRAEEQVALEPDHLDRLAVLGQQPALLGRPQHVARVAGAAAGRPHRIDPRVVEREHRQPGDDPDHDALDETQPDQGQQHQQQDAAIGQRQLGPAIEGQIRRDAKRQIDQHEAEQQLRHIGEERARRTAAPRRRCRR